MFRRLISAKCTLSKCANKVISALWLKAAAVAIVVVGCLIENAAYADEVIGCPKGLQEGQWWWRNAFTIQSMDEKYDRASDSMVDLPAGWKKQVIKHSYRLGYSPQDRWDFGLLLIGNEVQVRQYSQGNLQAFNTASLADVWLAGGYMLCQDEEWGIIDSLNVKVGAGYKIGSLSNLSDTDIKRGVGNGTDTLRVGVLTNSQIGRWELCNHLLYDFRGTAPEINGWKFSGEDLADRLNYKFNVGYALNEKVLVHAGLVGWMDVDAEKLAGNAAGTGFDGEKLYMHNLQCGFEYSPEGQEHNVIKLYYGNPLSAKNGMAPGHIVGCTYMFTWD